MEKVLLLCGSPRKGGNTERLLEICAREIEAAGLATETVLLAGKDIRSCVACGRCEELGECSLGDGLNAVIAGLRECRGFIVGSPVYFGTARGDVMSALQRIGMVSRASDGFLSRKVGGPVVVARRGGHTATIQEMLMFFFINDMVVPGSTYWNMVFGKTPGEIDGDAEGLETVRRFAANVAWLVKRLA
ncbi:MAG: flavodoxin family protein [Gemmatimonadetes bacterium]|nr:flavodoxin family protein [Gemmatimonadota bacterium]